MTATLPETTNTRVSIVDGWAVRDLPNGDQVRARMVLDRDCSEPERDGTGVLLVRESDGYGGVDLDGHDGLLTVLDRTYAPANARAHFTQTGTVRRECGDLMDWLRDGVLNIPREEFVRRYLRAFHGVADAFLYRHHGHSQSDWADIWVIVESVRPYGWDEDWTISREGAMAVADEWSDWAKGDCYVVESQARTLAEAMEDGDWSEVMSDSEYVGGYIGDAGAVYGLAEALDVPESQIPAPYEVTSA